MNGDQYSSKRNDATDGDDGWLRDEGLGRDPDRTARVSTDRLFELLSSPGNRFVLTYLLKANGPVEYVELVEYVLDRTETPTGMTDAVFRGRVAATLINERLPELETAGLVEIDSTEQRLYSTPATQVAAPHLALSLSDLVSPVE